MQANNRQNLLRRLQARQKRLRLAEHCLGALVVRRQLQPAELDRAFRERYGREPAMGITNGYEAILLAINDQPLSLVVDGRAR